MRIAVCDDDAHQARYIGALADVWAKKNGFAADVRVFDGAEAFVFCWSEDKSVDILLLDIQMRGQDGVSLAREIRREDDHLAIIFITGYSEYLSEGYEVSALHYLLKPVDEKKFFLALDRAAARMSREEKALLLDAGGSLTRVNQSEILCVEAFAHKSAVETRSGRLEVQSSIGALERSLDPNLFVRCHRSYLANLAHIQRVERDAILLDGGKYLPLSRRLFAGVHRAFVDFYRRDE